MLPLYLFFFFFRPFFFFLFAFEIYFPFFALKENVRTPRENYRRTCVDLSFLLWILCTTTPLKIQAATQQHEKEIIIIIPLGRLLKWL